LISRNKIEVSITVNFIAEFFLFHKVYYNFRKINHLNFKIINILHGGLDIKFLTYDYMTIKHGEKGKYHNVSNKLNENISR